MPRPPNPQFDAAFGDALAMFGALGRADRLAREATADYFDPPRENLLRRLYLYAWTTRHARHHVEHHRKLARNAIACYRALKARDRGERRQRAAA